MAGPGWDSWEGTGWGHLSLQSGNQHGGVLSPLEDGPGILFAGCTLSLLAGSLVQPTHCLAWPQPGAQTLPRRDPKV